MKISYFLVSTVALILLSEFVSGGYVEPEPYPEPYPKPYPKPYPTTQKPTTPKPTTPKPTTPKPTTPKPTTPKPTTPKPTTPKPTTPKPTTPKPTTTTEAPRRECTKEEVQRDIDRGCRSSRDVTCEKGSRCVDEVRDQGRGCCHCEPRCVPDDKY